LKVALKVEAFEAIFFSTSRPTDAAPDRGEKAPQLFAPATAIAGRESPESLYPEERPADQHSFRFEW
jgi:hypothetical protein